MLSICSDTRPVCGAAAMTQVPGQALRMDRTAVGFRYRQFKLWARKSDFDCGIIGNPRRCRLDYDCVGRIDRHGFGVSNRSVSIALQARAAIGHPDLFCYAVTVYHAMGIREREAIDSQDQPYNLLSEGAAITELFGESQ